MEIKIQSIHFDATEKLQEFIEKKVAKLEKTFEDIKTAKIRLIFYSPKLFGIFFYLFLVFSLNLVN